MFSRLDVTIATLVEGRRLHKGAYRRRIHIPHVLGLSVPGQLRHCPIRSRQWRSRL